MNTLAVYILQFGLFFIHFDIIPQVVYKKTWLISALISINQHLGVVNGITPAWIRIHCISMWIWDKINFIPNAGAKFLILFLYNVHCSGPCVLS